MNNFSQKAAVLEYMQKNGTITPIEALRYIGSFRLGAIIWDLKQEGRNIINLNKTGDERYAKYRLINRKNDKWELIEQCKEKQETYPVNHTEYKKIKEQIERLKCI